MLELGRSLRQCGVEVHIGCPAGAPLALKAAADGIAVTTIAKGGLIDRHAIGILKGLLKSGRIDLIHAHNGRTALSAALATWLAGRGRCVFTQHFLEPNRMGRRGLKAWLSALAYAWINRRIHRFIAISEAVKAGILHRAEAPEARITVIPNGISPPDATPLDLGLPEGAPLIVCVARLQKEKDIGSLVAAMAIVAAALPAAVCVVAGEGAEQEALQARIDALSLQTNMRLLGFREDALSLIASADLFVLPSLAEPFGLVLLEAMALGKPVIATRAGGPVEIVTDATGRLVRPSDPKELAAAILSLLQDPLLRTRMGAAGQLRFEECFTADRMARATFAAYEQACASS